MQNIFVDFEFNRKKKEITQIGATYNKKYFSKNIQNLENDLREFYNFLPNTDVNFIFFGEEDMNILEKATASIELPDEIKGMIIAISSGIDIRNYLKPLSLSLIEILNNIGGNIAYPVHDALNDAINLETLFIKLSEKKIISKLTKLSQKADTNKTSLIIHNNINELFKALEKGSYKKGQVSVQQKRVFIDKTNGHEYVFNYIDIEKTEKTIAVCAKIPKIISDFNGNKQECSIYLLEHIDGKTLSISNPFEDMSLCTGMNIEFCEKFIQELVNKGYLYKISKNEYQLVDFIELNSGNERRVMVSKTNKNKISILY